MKYLIAILFALALAAPASARHHGNQQQQIVVQKVVQPNRATPFRRNDVVIVEKVVVGHNQQFRQNQQFNVINHHHNAQNFRQAQYEAALLREALRQQQNLANDCPCHNDGSLQFRQNFSNGCSSLYR